MRVWIDQDLCTGDGICIDHCPDVFVQLEDGIAYVAEGGMALNDPGGSGSLAAVPDRAIADVIHAAEACPGECIFIEADAPAVVADPADVEPGRADGQAA
ncbi:MAG: ferredoxin [Actinomycetota bacterium]